MTAITEEGAARIREALPETAQLIYGRNNGQRVVQERHSDQLLLTDNLELFRRAEAGDPDAIGQLLIIAGHHDRRRAAPVVSAISVATSPGALAALRKGMVSDSPPTRRTAVEALAKQYFDALVTAIRDKDPHVRWTAVDSLATLGQGQSSRPLDILLRTLQDDADTVRAAAARVLGSNSDERCVEALKTATDDDSSFVRRNAEESLRQIMSLTK